jgi:hypothetical protein
MWRHYGQAIATVNKFTEKIIQDQSLAPFGGTGEA